MASHFKSFFVLALTICGLSTCTNRITKHELLQNVALNTKDVHESVWKKEINGYPHATSNSEFPGDASKPQYHALNAIDGKTSNRGHGPQFPSWGPEKRRDLWWKVDFGKTVTLSKVVIYIRADFTPYCPVDHDSFWKQGSLRFSDNSAVPIKFTRTADAQVFEFKPCKTTYLLINDLVEDEPLDWCAFVEVEAWGNF